MTTSRTPCAFAAAKLVIAPGASVTVTSVYGHADTLETFVDKYSPKVREMGYIAQQRQVARDIPRAMTSKVRTSTSSALFNAYVEQDYLDNCLRGGLPVILASDSAQPKVGSTPTPRAIVRTRSRD